MKIAIYQIAIERDENSLAFQSLNHIISVSNGRVPAELYDCVFAGEASAQTLEDMLMTKTHYQSWLTAYYLQNPIKSATLPAQETYAAPDNAPNTLF